MKKIIFRSIAVLCALGCGLAVCRAAGIVREYKIGERTYDELADIMVTSAASDIYVKADSSGAEAPEHAPIDVDFAALGAMNADAVGWLYCPGTEINYPVVQSSDNAYYLNRLYNGQANSSGAIFMDANSSPDLSDINTVIYGHNMKNGSMFAALQNYSEQWYYERHPVMYYLTKDRDYKIDVFASYETEGDSYAFTKTFTSPESYLEYLRRAWGNSNINTSWLPMSVEDNIITLSTCAYDFNNARYIVQGKVTPLN